MTPNNAPIPASDQTVGYEAVNTADLSGGDDRTVGLNSVPILVPTESQLGSAKSRPSFATSSSQPKNAHGELIPPEALIGPYEILDELGRGGMGVVYRARHIHLNRIAALKMILGNFVGQEHLERFRGEAEAVAKLDHPNIVRVYDVGEHEGNPFIALELIEGGNLAKKANGKPQNAQYAVQTVETLCRALHAAHLQKIVHRDLKPANVLLTLDGQPKVTDFGLAKHTEHAASGMTNAGSILGTPSYMAPEQAAGRVMDIGPATDVYSLGAILYELLTGHPPFRGESAIQTIRLVLDNEAVSPRTLVPTVPKDVDTICLKALQKPSHRRYESAEAMAEDLRRFLDNEPILARPIGTIERFTKWVKRRPTTAAIIATGIVALLAMVSLGIFSYIAVTKRAKEAELAKKDADDAHAEGIRRLVRLNVSTGTRLLDSRDYLPSVLWFAEALRLERGGPDRERMHRLRLHAVLERCPTPVQFWLHDAAVTAGAYDATGKRVITAGDDGIARVWDPETGQPVAPPLEHGSAVKYAALTPDGLYAATAAADGNLRVWKLQSGSVIFSASLSVQFTGLALTPKGDKVAVCGAAGRVRIWEIPSGKDVSVMTAAFIDRTTGMAFSPDGTKYVVGSVDFTARVYDTATSQPITPLFKHAGPVLAVAFMPDGKRVVTASGDGSAQIWNVATGQPQGAAFKHADDITSVAVSPDGTRLVTGSADHTAQVWDVATGRMIGRPAIHASNILSVSFSPDGRWYSTGSDDNTARVWDALTGEPVTPPFRGNSSPTVVKFAPNGHQLLVTRTNRIAIIWELINRSEQNADDTPLKQNPVHNRNDVVNVTNPDGGMVVSYGGGQAVRIRRATDFEPLTPALRTGAVVSTAAFSPDGKCLATGDEEGAIMLWDVTTGIPLWNTSARHASKVFKICFDSTGTKMASVSDDNTAAIWRKDTGEALVPAIRIGSSGNDVSFNSKGDILFTQIPGGISRLWDATTGEPITPPIPTRANWENRLTMDSRPTEDLIQLGQVLAAVKLTESGGIVTFDTNERRTAWQALKNKEPERFQLESGELKQWHESQAKASEAAGQWFAAGWHLDQLLERNPLEVTLRQRRGQAAANMNDWTRAASDANMAIRSRPTNADAWYQRGLAYGQLGDWDAAAMDLAKAVELKNNPHISTGFAAKVALSMKDVATFRKAASDEFNLHKDSTDMEDVANMVWVCLLHKDTAGIAPTKLLSLLDKVPANADTSLKMVVSLAQIRAGKSPEAITVLKPLCESMEDRPVAWACLALAYKSQGNVTEEKKWNTKAKDWLKTKKTGTPTRWDTVAETIILLDE